MYVLLLIFVPLRILQMNENFNPVEKFKRWPYNVNWKMVALGELLIIAVVMFGIVHSYAS